MKKTTLLKRLDAGKLRLLFVLLCLLVQGNLWATIYYVSTSGNDLNTGTSWLQAFRTPRKAMLTAVAGDQIWVAAGTYKPDQGGGAVAGDRKSYFIMKNNVAIYGGFAGNELLLSQRNLKFNVTTLSGDIGVAGSRGDNSYHLFYNEQGLVNSTAILDGFVLTEGNSNGVESEYTTYGGAIINITNCSPTITNCTFINNSCSVYGGAVCNIFGSMPVYTNCLFFGNSGQLGGAFANYDANATLINCSFASNNATFSGAIRIVGSAGSVISNCIVWGNSSGIGGDPAIVSYSIVQEGYAGSFILNQDPLFENVAAGNLHLQACSPAINAGNNAANSTPNDVESNPRKINTIDMGAYEFTGTPRPLSTYYRDNDNDGYDAGTAQFCSLTPPAGYKATTLGSDCNDADPTVHTPILYYRDNDNDGYDGGSAAFCQSSPPAGYKTSTLGSDCNDNNANEHPGQTWYIDSDGDHYGGSSQVQCARPTKGYLLSELAAGSNGTDDCNDADPSVHYLQLYYKDSDNDGYDGGTEKFCSSTPPSGYKATTLGSDCNDNDANEHPGQTWYIDADGDHYGGSSQIQCTRPANGYLLSELAAGSTGTDDCNDADPSVHYPKLYYQDSDNDGYDGGTAMFCSSTPPSGYKATTLGSDCNDNDANEHPGQTWYIDADGDHYGGSSQIQCTRPANGYLLSELAAGSTGTDDCNDADPSVHYSKLYYQDSDNDGYDGGTAMFCSSTPPSGYKATTLGSDCNDTDPNEHPGQTWYIDADGDHYGGSTQTQCNRPPNGYLLSELAAGSTGTDDCNDADASVHYQQLYYKDNDNDGYDGGTAMFCSSTPPSGYKATTLGSDCNDNDANEHPGQTWYIDADGDHYGGSSVTQCSRPAHGFLLSELAAGSTGTDDCNDADPSVHYPKLYYKDSDNDGYDGGTVMFCYSTPPSGYKVTTLGSDCNDNDANEHPGQTWYIDADGDHYGGSSVTQCSRPSHGYLLNELAAGSTGTDDCNDADASVHYQQLYYKDSDNDGYDGGTAMFCSSTPPSGYKATTLGSDCNDNDPAVHYVQTYYRDFDQDGYGDPANKMIICQSTPPTGYVTNNEDCNDNDDDINPETDWWRDDDADGYGNPNIMFTGCIPPAGKWVMNNYDCDDAKNDTKHPENNEVLMCRNNKQECVKVKDILKKQNDGWVLGPCAMPCKDGKVLMCHKGKLHCVKEKDVPKRLSQGWTLGYCGATAPVAVQNESKDLSVSIAMSFSLSSYPNPFDASASIQYYVPVDAHISIKVYDLLGREITTIVDADKQAGKYSMMLNLGKFSNGIYHCRMIAEAGGGYTVLSLKLLKGN